MPGETEETLAETIAWVQALPADGRGRVRRGRACLSRHAAGATQPRPSPSRSCAWATGRSTRSPSARSARRGRSRGASTRASAAGRATTLLGVGYRSASRAPSEAYRLVRARADRAEWQAMLDRVAGSTRTPQLRGALLQIALWHGRHDLAVPTLDAMLAAGDGDDPTALRRARRVYAVMGATGRLGRLVRRGGCGAIRACEPHDRDPQAVRGAGAILQKTQVGSVAPNLAAVEWSASQTSSIRRNRDSDSGRPRNRHEDPRVALVPKAEGGAAHKRSNVPRPVDLSNPRHL